MKKRDEIRFFIPKNTLKTALVACCGKSWYLRAPNYEILKANHNGESSTNFIGSVFKSSKLRNPESKSQLSCLPFIFSLGI
jgi:hypothetical protein